MSDGWVVAHHPKAKKFFQKCRDRRLLGRVKKAIENMRSDPQNAGVKVVGQDGVRRLRVGDWRVLFTPDEETRTISIRDIRPRGSAYEP